MINENTVILGGRLIGKRRLGEGAEIGLRVPFGRGDDVGAQCLRFDLPGEEGFSLAKGLKKGDFVMLTGYLVNEAEGDGKVLRARWDTYARPTVVRGSGGMPDLTAENKNEGANLVRLGGYASLTYKDREDGLERPSLRNTQGGTPMSSFEIGFMDSRNRDNKSYFRVTVFGATAEKIISRYMNPGDNILVRGQLGLMKGRDSDEPVQTIQVAPFNGVSKVTPEKRNNQQENRPRRDSGGWDNDQTV